MGTSGTFISDLRLELMAHDYFSEMPEIARKTADFGILVSSIVEPLLDYILVGIDIEKVGLLSREDLIDTVITKHGIVLMVFIKSLIAGV